jgi:hypothetical protein
MVELSNFSKYILIEGLDDWFGMFLLGNGFIDRKVTPEEFIVESKAAVKPLLDQGFMVMGDLSAGPFAPWDLSPGESWERFEKEFLRKPEKEGLEWEFGVWMCLTPEGEKLAKAIEAENPDPLNFAETWPD